MPKQAKSQPARRSFTPVAVRRTHHGWTPAKQGEFIDALAETGCVQDACAHVGMSRQSAYTLRMRPEAQGFRIAWDAALDFAIRRLSDEVMSRALNGEVVPHYYKGELVGEHRRYDNKLAMFLLRYRDPLRYAASLDQMVYSGHPEHAAVAFAKARAVMEHAAHGLSDDAVLPPDPTGTPYARKPRPQVAAEQATQALVESDAPIGGSHARRTALHEARAAHHARRRAEAQVQAARQEQTAHAQEAAGTAPAHPTIRGPHPASSHPIAPTPHEREGAPPTLASIVSTLARQGLPAIRCT